MRRWVRIDVLNMRLWKGGMLVIILCFLVILSYAAVFGAYGPFTIESTDYATSPYWVGIGAVGDLARSPDEASCLPIV